MGIVDFAPWVRCRVHTALCSIDRTSEGHYEPRLVGVHPQRWFGRLGPLLRCPAPNRRLLAILRVSTDRRRGCTPTSSLRALWSSIHGNSSDGPPRESRNVPVVVPIRLLRTILFGLSAVVLMSRIRRRHGSGDGPFRGLSPVPIVWNWQGDSGHLPELQCRFVQPFSRWFLHPRYPTLQRWRSVVSECAHSPYASLAWGGGGRPTS